MLERVLSGKTWRSLQDSFYLKPVLAFQTFTLAMLGTWATTRDRVGQGLLLDFAAWSDLTSNDDNTILSSFEHQSRGHFGSFKCADNFRVFQGFMMPLNNQVGVLGT